MEDKIRREKISSNAFYGNYYGHTIEHLEKVYTVQILFFVIYLNKL